MQEGVALKLSALLYIVLLALLPACAAPQTPASSTADDVARICAFLGRIEQVFDASDLDAAAAIFADDAMIVNGGSVDAVGKDAIRALYAGALAATSLRVRFHTEEIVARGDLAYERGTYDLEVTDKATGRQVQAVTRRHVHILVKQPSGEWKTWRMFTDSMAVEEERAHDRREVGKGVCARVD